MLIKESKSYLLCIYLSALFDDFRSTGNIKQREERLANTED